MPNATAAMQSKADVPHINHRFVIMRFSVQGAITWKLIPQHLSAVKVYVLFFRMCISSTIVEVTPDGSLS
jgi:hypothetical protein